MNQSKQQESNEKNSNGSKPEQHGETSKNKETFNENNLATTCDAVSTSKSISPVNKTNITKLVAHSGFEYELLNILCILARARNQGVQEIKIVSNVEWYGHFDDIAGECTFKDGSKEYFCMALIYRRQMMKLNKDQFVRTGTTGPFNLKKYCQIIRNDFYKDSSLNVKFMILTTMHTDSSVKYTTPTLSNNILRLINTGVDPSCIKRIDPDKNPDILKAVDGNKEFLERLHLVTEQKVFEHIREIILKEVMQFPEVLNDGGIANEVLSSITIELDNWYMIETKSPLDLVVLNTWIKSAIDEMKRCSRLLIENDKSINDCADTQLVSVNNSPKTPIN